MYDWKKTAYKIIPILVTGALASLLSAAQSGELAISSGATTIVIAVVRGVMDYLKHSTKEV